ncbi:MAG: hypothetical protein IKO91_02775 [Oscillospiraceae bacterium]|nr:hypothetical protein [Oscillospiraceae bacterium]
MEHIRAFLRAFTPRRRAVYLIGVVLLACGIALNTKTDLGVAPILSVAFVLSELSGIPFSLMSFFYYCFLILLQLLLLGRRFEQIQWLQLAASFLTSFFIGVFSRLIPAAEGLPLRIAVLLLAILLTGTGIILSVGARFVPNPGDGMANAIALRSGKSLGFSKNLLDMVSFLIALSLGLLFRGRLLGVGAGTVVTMLLTGRVVALLQKPVLRLAGLEEKEQ